MNCLLLQDSDSGFVNEVHPRGLLFILHDYEVCFALVLSLAFHALVVHVPLVLYAHFPLFHGVLVLYALSLVARVPLFLDVPFLVFLSLVSHAPLFLHVRVRSVLALHVHAPLSPYLVLRLALLSLLFPYRGVKDSRLGVPPV
jgi:hypothetical protein